jgi:TolB-like protein
MNGADPMPAEGNKPDQNRESPDQTVSADEVREQLQRLLTDAAFRATDAQRAFLSFVVEKVLAGESDEIKGYTIATRVFGRREDFDQSTDPIVSIQANKLRRALEHYYLTAGQQDPLRIGMPKGTYVPTFERQTAVQSGAGRPKDRAEADLLESAWPTVLVQLFQNLTGDPGLDYIAHGLATELATEITRYQDIRVLMVNAATPGKRASDSGARFTIDGSVRKDAHGIKVAVGLNDTRTGIHLWGDTHRCDLEAARLISFQEQVARVVTAKIAGETGIVAKALSIESKKVPPSDAQTYHAILRYYQFDAQFSAATFFNALEALEQATAREPECGLAWSMLARLYAGNHSLELFDRPTPLEKAGTFAERGVQLDPANQRTRLILSFVRLLQSNLTGALSEVDRALALNPRALILKDHIGYLMTLCGDWDRGPALIRKAIQLNPYYDVIVHHALWVDFVRQKDDEQAYLETLNFRMPTLFWEPLLKASVLGMLGRIDEGRQAMAELLKLKPDFQRDGRRLIRNYLKFDEILDRTVKGLQRCGLEIE